MKFTDNNLSDSLVQKAKEMLEAGGPSIKYDQEGAHVCDSTGKVIRSFKQRDNGSKFKKDAQNFLTSKMRELNAAYEPELNESAVASIPKSDWEKAKKSRTKGVIIKGLDGKTHEYSWKKGPDGKPDSRLGKDPKTKKRIKSLWAEEKGRGPTGIAYSVTPGHPDAENPKTREKYPERQTPEYKAKWKKKSKPGLKQYTGLKNPMKEENLDELSKDTLKSYTKKKLASGEKLDSKAVKKLRTAGQKIYDKEYSKTGKPVKDKDGKTVGMVHNEETVNEISNATKDSYYNKAKKDLAGQRDKYFRPFDDSPEGAKDRAEIKRKVKNRKAGLKRAAEDKNWPRPFSKSERDDFLKKKKEDYKKSLKDGKLKEVTSMPAEMPIKTPRIKKFKLKEWSDGRGGDVGDATPQAQLEKERSERLKKMKKKPAPKAESTMYDDMKTLAKMRQQKKDAAFHAGLVKVGAAVDKAKAAVKKKLGLSKEEWNQDAEFYLEPLAEAWFDTQSWPTHKDHRRRTAHRKFADAVNSPKTLKKRQKMGHAQRKAYDAAIKKRLDKEHGVGSKHETTPLPKHLHHPKVKLNNSYDNFGEFALDMIDELSTDMLVRYISKASNAKGHKGMHPKKVDNRYDGVAKAGEILDKRLSGKSMKKEDIQFNEDVKAASKIPYKKEYYQGNYSGAAKAIEKKYGSKVLKHKKVQDALRKANEQMEKEFSDSLLERAVSQIGFMYQDKAKEARKKDNTKLKAKQKVYAKKQQSVGQKVRPEVIDMQAQTEIQGPMLSEETLDEINTNKNLSKAGKAELIKKKAAANKEIADKNLKQASGYNPANEDVDDKKPYVQEKDGKFCLYDREGNLVKEFDDKAEAEKHMSKMMSESFRHYNVTHKKTGKKYRVTAMHSKSAAEKARAQHGGTASRYTGTSSDDFHVEEYVEEGKMVPGFMGADGKPTSKPTKKDYEANKEYQSMKKKGVAPKVKEEGWEAGDKHDEKAVKSIKKDVKDAEQMKKEKKLGIRETEVKSFYEAAREIMFEKMAKKDHDGDGKIETKRQEWKGSKDKAIKKAMNEFKADGEDSEIADPVDVPVDPKKREKETKLLKKKPSKEEIKKALAKEEIELLAVNEDETIDIMFKHEDEYIVEKNINISEISDKMKLNYIKKANKEITKSEKERDKIQKSDKPGHDQAYKSIMDLKHKSDATKRRLGVRQARSKLGQ